MTKRIPEAAWAAELHRFTNRNAGRSTTIEIDSPDFGAQSQERGVPLRGVSYDARDEKVLITVGERNHGGHLTHSIAGPLDIFLLIDLRGRDEALAIKQGSTSTLLRFLDL